MECPREGVLDNSVGEAERIVGQERELQDSEGVAGDGGDEHRVGAGSCKGDAVPLVGQLRAADRTGEGVAHLTAKAGTGEQEAVGSPAVAQHLQPIDADVGRGAVVGRGRFVETEDRSAMGSWSCVEAVCMHEALRGTDTCSGQLHIGIEKSGVAHADSVTYREEDACRVVYLPRVAERGQSCQGIGKVLQPVVVHVHHERVVAQGVPHLDGVDIERDIIAVRGQLAKAIHESGSGLGASGGVVVEEDGHRIAIGA